MLSELKLEIKITSLKKHKLRPTFQMKSSAKWHQLPLNCNSAVYPLCIYQPFKTESFERKPFMYSDHVFGLLLQFKRLQH